MKSGFVHSLNGGGAVAHLSVSDMSFIRKWRETSAAVLQDTKGHLLDQTNGIILVTCGDRDRAPEIFKFQALMQAQTSGDPKIHILSWNGGALRLTKRSPTNKHGRSTDRDFLDEIHDAISIKNILTVALYIHFPCGKATACGLGFRDCIEFLFKAKERIKMENEGVRVACFCHIDYGNSIQRTYFVSKERYSAWLKDCYQRT